MLELPTFLDVFVNPPKKIKTEKQLADQSAATIATAQNTRKCKKKTLHL